MSEQKTAVQLMLEAYEAQKKPQYDNTKEKFNEKNYCSPLLLPDGVNSKMTVMRVLPNPNSALPWTTLYVHEHTVEGAKSKSKFPCLRKEGLEGGECPFCEAREVLLATGNAQDKETAKKYNYKKTYVVKVIDRANESDGPKFWRFNHDSRNTGAMDKLMDLTKFYDADVTDPENGRDISVMAGRDQKGFPVVTAILGGDKTPLSKDAELSEKWINDPKTWKDVYGVKTYSYLEVCVKGGIPYFDQTKNCYVDKKERDAAQSNTKSELDTELTMGIEAQKAQLLANNDTNDTPPVPSQGDDLPF